MLRQVGRVDVLRRGGQWVPPKRENERDFVVEWVKVACPGGTLFAIFNRNSQHLGRGCWYPNS